MTKYIGYGIKIDIYNYDTNKIQMIKDYGCNHIRIDIKEKITNKIKDDIYCLSKYCNNIHLFLLISYSYDNKENIKDLEEITYILKDIKEIGFRLVLKTYKMDEYFHILYDSISIIRSISPERLICIRLQSHVIPQNITPINIIETLSKKFLYLMLEYYEVDKGTPSTRRIDSIISNIQHLKNIFSLPIYYIGWEDIFIAGTEDIEEQKQNAIYFVYLLQKTQTSWCMNMIDTKWKDEICHIFRNTS